MATNVRRKGLTHVETVGEALTSGMRSMPSSTQVGLSLSTWKIPMIVGRKSAVVVGVDMFLFSKITHGIWIIPGTRIPPSHELALHWRRWPVE